MMQTHGKKQIRIVIIDRHLMVRLGLRILIETNQEMVVVGEAGDGNEALIIVAREQPDIILFDPELKEQRGLDCLSDLSEIAKKSRVLIVTGLNDVNMHRRAVHLGAMGVVLKDQSGEVLMKAIKKVCAGETWLDRLMMARILAESGRRGSSENLDPEPIRIAALTEREREVIVLVCEGLKTRRIAEQLFISEKTVSNHLASIYFKLGVSDRLELALYAYRQQMVRPPSFERRDIPSVR